MDVIKTASEIQRLAATLHASGKKIGFVPTMGYLHEGHLSLVRRARSENEIVIVSIFVNPTQFGPGEDFQKYPRDFERDKNLLEELTDYLFYPPLQEMYATDEKIRFDIEELTACLCGLSRPGHFEGVALIVTKLFHLIQPDTIHLGQKDYQQTVVIKKLVRDLFFPVQVVVCETVREHDGLAMSSRNVFLDSSQRSAAPLLYQALQLGVDFLEQGEKNTALILQKMNGFLQSKKLTSIDYLDIRDAESLRSVTVVGDKPVVVAGALFIGTTRLIDNILFTPHASQK